MLQALLLLLPEMELVSLAQETSDYTSYGLWETMVEAMNQTSDVRWNNVEMLELILSI